MIKNLFGLFIIFICSNVFAQYENNSIRIALGASYTATSEIFFFPNSTDPVLRNSSFPVDDIYNSVADVRYGITDDVILGLSAEYIKKSTTGNNLTAFVGGNTVAVTVENGFRLIPIELSLYYLIPFSTDKFKFLMGGGVGYYIGSLIRSVGDAEVVTKSRDNSFGIQVSVGMDYLFKNDFSFYFEMKFRDPQFEVISQFDKSETTLNGQQIQLPANPFETKINLDGLVFIIGAALHFP